MVGDGIGFELELGCWEAEGFSESPRAGRAACWVELIEDSGVSGESCEGFGGEAENNVGSRSGRLSLADMSTAGELLRGSRCCCGGGVLVSESLRFDSAFLFFGTSCSLKGSVVAVDAVGEVCWLRVRASVAGTSLTPSFRFLSVSTSVSDCCLPFS